MATKHAIGAARMQAESRRVDQAKKKVLSTGTHWGCAAMNAKANLTFHATEREVERTLTQSLSGSNTTNDTHHTMMSQCLPKP